MLKYYTMQHDRPTVKVPLSQRAEAPQHWALFGDPKSIFVNARYKTYCDDQTPCNRHMTSTASCQSKPTNMRNGGFVQWSNSPGVSCRNVHRLLKQRMMLDLLKNQQHPVNRTIDSRAVAHSKAWKKCAVLLEAPVCHTCQQMEGREEARRHDLRWGQTCQSHLV